MPLLTWNEELQLQHPRMDATHEEFVDCVTAVEDALAAAGTMTAAAGTPLAAPVLAAYDALIEHSVEHFGQEDRWMLATGFSADNCHSSQHTQVLAVLREVRRIATEGAKPETIGQLLPELVQWFVQHAQAADAGLAGHLQEIGFDTDSGACAVPAEAGSLGGGCGSSSCDH